jgi:hypothetical protein
MRGTLLRRNGEGAPTLQAEWSRWLRQWPWALFITLTLEHERPASRLLELAHAYLEAVQQLLGTDWWWMFVVEEGGHSRRNHVHMLVGGVAEHAVEVFREAWTTRLLHGPSAGVRPLGLLTVEPYDPKRGGRSYVVKELRHDREWDIDVGVQQKVRAWHERRRREARAAGRLRVAAETPMKSGITPWK